MTATSTAAAPGPCEIARLDGRLGPLVLRRAADGHHEVVSNGTFLMDTRDGRSERGLATAALDAHPTPGGRRLDVLVAGLGVGFTLGAALADERVARVTVVELEPAVARLVREHTGARTGAVLADARVRLVLDDVHDVLARGHGPSWDVVCLDVDNGPGWTLGPGNDRLYTRAGLDTVRARLRPGGVVAVWTAHDAPWFADLLDAAVGPVTAHAWDVPRGEPDRVWVACSPGVAA